VTPRLWPGIEGGIVWMRAKAAFVVGAGFGYVLGTRAGRGQYDRMKAVASAVWTHPLVQRRVSGLEVKVADVARARSAAVIDRLADAVKSVLHVSPPATRGGASPSRDSGTPSDLRG
jgi:hypothetical protein